MIDNIKNKAQITHALDKKIKSTLELFLGLKYYLISLLIQMTSLNVMPIYNNN